MLTCRRVDFPTTYTMSTLAKLWMGLLALLTFAIVAWLLFNNVRRLF